MNGLEVTCKNCDKTFHAKVPEKIKVYKPRLGKFIEIDLKHHFTTNDFTVLIETPKQKTTIDVGDTEIKVRCTICGQSKMYFLTEIIPI